MLLHDIYVVIDDKGHYLSDEGNFSAFLGKARIFSVIEALEEANKLNLKYESLRYCLWRDIQDKVKEIVW